MGLRGKSELLRLNDIVDVVLVFTDRIFGTSILASLCRFGEDLSSETGVVHKQLGCVNSRDRVDGNVRRLVLETAMDVNARVN